MALRLCRPIFVHVSTDIPQVACRLTPRSFVQFLSGSEPLFDAADVLRFGRDLVVQHGFTTNLKGIE